jgi:thioredoxin-related protein
MNRRNLAAALLVWIASGAALSSGTTAGARAGPYDPERDPARDLSAALAEAKRDEKRVLLEVGGNWCGWCRAFDRFVHTDESLAEAMRCAFVVVHVNVSPENENVRFLSGYPEVPGYPYFFVLAESGERLASVDTDDFLTGEKYDRRKLLAFIRRWGRPEAKAGAD